MTQEQKMTKTKSQLDIGERSVLTGKVIWVSAQGSRYDGAQSNGIYPGELPIELGVHLLPEGASGPQFLRGVGPVDAIHPAYDPNWKTNLVEIYERVMDAFINYSTVTVEYISMGPTEYPLIRSIR
jgi:hypothetical protein